MDLREIRDLLQGNAYVDKSLLIRDVLEAAKPVSVYLRPLGFGKTTALQLFTLCVSCDIDETELTAGLKIHQEMSLPRHPVIFVSFEELRNIQSFQDFQTKFYNVVRRVYSQMGYLERTPTSREGLQSSIRTLSSLAREESGTTVVVLLDGYDVPLLDVKGWGNGCYRVIEQYLTAFLSQTFSDNPNMICGVLTGYVELKKLLNFEYRLDSLFEGGTVEYFGFTAEEVNSYVSRHSSLDPQHIQTRTGYTVIRHNRIFSPDFVVQFTARRHLAHSKSNIYYTDSGTATLVLKLLADVSSRGLRSLCRSADLMQDLFFKREKQTELLVCLGFVSVLENDHGTAFWNSFIQSLAAQPKKPVRRISLTHSNELDRSIHSSDLFKSTLKHEILPLIQYKNLTETGIEKHIAKVLQLQAESAYQPLCEQIITNTRGRLDTLFTPTSENSPLVLAEYKLHRGSTRGLDNILQNALLQVFIKQYVTCALSRMRESQTLEVRAVVFYRSETTFDWKLKTKSVLLTQSGAQNLNNWFEARKLPEATYKTQRGRKQFYEQNGFTCIEDLIQIAQVT